MADTHTGSTHNCAFTTKISAVSPFKKLKNPLLCIEGIVVNIFDRAPAHRKKGTTGLLNHCTELQRGGPEV